ncbi:MAG: hypothetical protein D6677_13025 [Calditrichaeota bacterium]|nr:MAG: hypothetical protein D6677_13025 [Calditrichota bacterium]
MKQRLARALWALILIALTQVNGDELFTKNAGFKEGRIAIVDSDNFPERPKIALVLSGGGARGMTHIGVLKVLEKNNIRPDFIVGTSIGAVVGGLYSAGYSAGEIEQMFRKINWGDMFRDVPARSNLFLEQKTEQDRYLISIRLKDGVPYIPNAVTPGQKVLNVLSDLFMLAPWQVKENFDDLRIPFRAVATDIVHGRMVVLDKGNLAAALNGSLAVPLLFSPVSWDSLLLVDGGVKANLPVSVAKKWGADIIIAADVSAGLRSREELNAPWEVADQVTTIMTGNNNVREYKDVDVLLHPRLPQTTNNDFSALDTLITLGASETEQHLNDIRRCITDRARKSGRFLFVKNNLTGRTDSLRLSILSQKMDNWIRNGGYSRVRARYLQKEQRVLYDFTPFAAIDTILIRGAKVISPQEVRDSLRTRTGHIPIVETLREDMERLLRMYHKRGYSLMTITGVHFLNNRLIIDLDEGKVGEIRVTGNRQTRDYVILREFQIAPGAPFNWLDVKHRLANLYGMQLFNRVTADIVRHDRVADIIVRVDEKPSVRVQLGGKADNDRLFQGYLELSDDNLLGRAIKAKLQARIGNRDGWLGGRFRSERIFTSLYTFTGQFYYAYQKNPFKRSDQTFTRYKQEQAGIKLLLGRQVERIGLLSAAIHARRVQITIDQGLVTTVNDLQLRSFILRSVIDKRDRIDFPAKGEFNWWEWEAGNSLILQSEQGFSKLRLHLETYQPLFSSDHVLHFRFDGGISDISTPFSEHFRIGGFKQYYGLLEKEKSGRQLFLLSAGYRWKLPFDIFAPTYLSVRYDFGNIWSKPSLSFKRSELLSAIGGYLGWDTFLGPLYLAWGQNAFGRRQVYLSLGFDY